MNGLQGGFTGFMKIRILEALDLNKTNVKSQIVTSMKVSSLDPYLQAYVDDQVIAKTSKRISTYSPIWEEDFSIDLHKAKILSLTVFHSSKVGADSFVANSSLPIQEIIDEGQSDLWVGTCVILYYCYLTTIKCSCKILCITVYKTLSLFFQI